MEKRTLGIGSQLGNSRGREKEEGKCEYVGGVWGMCLHNPSVALTFLFSVFWHGPVNWDIDKAFATLAHGCQIQNMLRTHARKLPCGLAAF